MKKLLYNITQHISPSGFESRIKIRYILFTIAVIGIISSIFIFRFELRYLIDLQIFGSQFNNPDSWQKKVPYGFDENKEEALNYYKKALYEIAERALDLYDKDAIINYKKPNSNTTNWQSSLSGPVLVSVITFFRDVGYYCSANQGDHPLYRKWRLKIDPLMYSVKDHLKKYDLDSAVISKHQDWLLQLDHKYLEPATQKKPDLRAALSLREDIILATCQLTNILNIWYQAAEYARYKVEKGVYQRLIAQNPNKQILQEYLQIQADKQLLYDTNYHELSKEFYYRADKLIPMLNWKLSESYKLIKTVKSKKLRRLYYQNLLDKARISGIKERKQMYDKLLHLKVVNFDSDFDYLYTLAELAYYARDYMRSKKIFTRLLDDQMTNDRAKVNSIEKRLFEIRLLLPHQ